jgi:erythromycin esterase
MKISYIKDKTAEIIIDDILLNNSVELHNASDIDLLIEKIGDAKYVLLGEASHGTHEYYTWRSEISKRLIENKEFSFIAVEGDWPDCYRLNRFIKNYSEAGNSALEVLQAFNRWPTWMWANWEIVALSEWLRSFNAKLPVNKKAGFYGLDVYSLWESFDAIIKYLDKKDSIAAHKAKVALKCFEPYSDGEGQSYAKATIMIPVLCLDEVVDLLLQVRKNMPSWNTDREAVMSAEQNAHVIVNAERYYRAMIQPGSESWNIRDKHMVETLNRLIAFHGPTAKAIVWAHNTHIGDARATDMVQQGTINIGQILSEHRNQDEVYSIGFGSFKGTVIAGKEWGDVMQVMDVPEAISDSWEFILHQLNQKDRIVFMNDELKNQIGKMEFDHRAIGVVYHPKYEHFGNYVPSLMPYRYNAFIYLDETSALHPLHIKPDGYQIPETFPFGL